MFSSYYSKATTTTRLQELVYILTDLGQLPLYTIYTNSLNLDCPRDSVNTVIIHSCSTRLPVSLGVISEGKLDRDA